MAILKDTTINGYTQINGELSATKLNIANNTSADYYLIGITSDKTPINRTASGQAVFVNSSGQLNAPSYNATSDARLKENFKEHVPTKSILDLPVYIFDFIDGAKNQLGCKAQDLQEICPEIVVKNEDGYLSIQESKLVYLLLEEIKTLKARLDTLENDSKIS